MQELLGLFDGHDIAVFVGRRWHSRTLATKLTLHSIAHGTNEHVVWNIKAQHGEAPGPAVLSLRPIDVSVFIYNVIPTGEPCAARKPVDWLRAYPSSRFDNLL